MYTPFGKQNRLARSRRCGSIVPMVVVGLPVLLAMMGIALDLGLLMMACQQCQDIADTGALAGSQELPCVSRAVSVGLQVASANAPAVAQFDVDATSYSRGEDLPGYGTTPAGGAVEITVSRQIPYVFLPVVGVNGATVRRSAVATRVGDSACIAPIWVHYQTPVDYGQPVQLAFDDSPDDSVAGTFGLLTPRGGADLDELIQGLASPENQELQRTLEGETWYANTGLSTDHWGTPLDQDPNSRLNRAEDYPWSTDTHESFRADNPRIMLVPFVRYIGGSGSSSALEVTGIGAFWLEDVDASGTRTLDGRFIDFVSLGGEHGVSATRLVR